MIFSAFCRTLTAALVLLVGSTPSQAERIAPPGEGKLYHGFYFDEPAAGADPTEHDVTAADVARFEKAIGSKTAWVFFSDNWSESRVFPMATCQWIRALGKVPYIRLMLRSNLDQDRREKIFSLQNILAGKFDADLKAWGRDATAFGSPLLIEWGTEPNGKWFSWNGKWNGGSNVGPRRYVEAYRHIVDLLRGEGANNLTWVWHVNWFDEPEKDWNRFENYYPGDNYCDWVGLSIYGPLTPNDVDGTESFRSKLSRTYPRLRKLASGKPIVISEFGCDIHHRKVDVHQWASQALGELFSNQWPAIIGFCWWNETWPNDDNKRHDTDMVILHDAALTKVFREQLGRHAEAVQETPVIVP